MENAAQNGARRASEWSFRVEAILLVLAAAATAWLALRWTRDDAAARCRACRACRASSRSELLRSLVHSPHHAGGNICLPRGARAARRGAAAYGDAFRRLQRAKTKLSLLYLRRSKRFEARDLHNFLS